MKAPCPAECKMCGSHDVLDENHCCRKYLNYCVSCVELCKLQNSLNEEPEDPTREP